MTAPSPTTDPAPVVVVGRDRWTRSFWPLLAAIAALAVGVRAAVLALVPSQNAIGIPGGDGFYYLRASQALANTGVFGVTGSDGVVRPDVLHPPLWTLYLALTRLLGAATIDQMRIVSMALGILTVVLVALAGRQLLSARTGLIAAIVVAVSPAFWTYERNLNAEAITFPLLAATILLAYRYRARPTLARCLALGAVVGLLGLARTEQAIAGVIVILVLVLRTSDLDLVHRLGRLALSGVVVLAVVSPWTIHNVGKFENPVLLSSGSGNAMLAGACDTTFSGDGIGGYDPDCNQKNPIVFTTKDRTVLDGRQRDAAIEYSLDHLGQLPGVVVAREGRAWAFFRVGQQNEIQAAALDLDPAWVWVQTVVFWVSVPLALAGTVLLRRQKIAVYPLWIFPAFAALSVAITFGDIRYRAAAEIPLVLLAVAAVDLLLRRRAGATTPETEVPVIDREVRRP